MATPIISLPSLTHFWTLGATVRRQARGPAPKPRWMPIPELLYARVVKIMRRRRIVEVKHHVIFGTKVAVDSGLSPLRLGDQHLLCRAPQSQPASACGRDQAAGCHAV